MYISIKNNLNKKYFTYLDKKKMSNIEINKNNLTNNISKIIINDYLNCYERCKNDVIHTDLSFVFIS